MQKTNAIFLMPCAKDLITCHDSHLLTLVLIGQWKVGVFVTSTHFFLECSLGEVIELSASVFSFLRGRNEAVISPGPQCGGLGGDVLRKEQLAAWFCYSQVRS